MKPELFWVPGPWRGKLAILTRPRGGDWLADEVTAWRDGGLDVIVSLLEKSEEAGLDLSGEAEASRSAGLNFISFPIPDRGVPTSSQAALDRLAEISTALASGSHVAVHCRQGVGRSGMIAAALLIRSEMDPEAALARVSQARGLVVPETQEQDQWVRSLPQLQLAANVQQK